jgi:hypothetical protein
MGLFRQGCQKSSGEEESMKVPRIKGGLAAGVGLLLGLAAWAALTTWAQVPSPRPEGLKGNGGAMGLAGPVGQSFTYQGQLKDSGGTPINGVWDFQFGLFDAASGGGQHADGGQCSGEQRAVHGPVRFWADGLWRQRPLAWGGCPAGSGSFTALNPRQALTAAPYALYALRGPYSAGTGLSLSNNQFSLAPTYQLPQGCSQGQVVQWGSNGWVCENAWFWGGNAGTTAGTHFLGTTDNQALELKVNGQRALRLEPTLASPNVVGGSGGNRVTTGVQGATIGGGGSTGTGCGGPCANQVTDSYGTVGGGYFNRAGDAAGSLTDAAYATVGGGFFGNTAGGQSATVGGGEGNTAGGWRSTVAGGQGNQALGSHATVGGGENNWVVGYRATVGGGRDNRVDADYGIVGGGQGNVVTGTYGTVGGGQGNQALADRATIAGGGDPSDTNCSGPCVNKVTASHGTVGGGSGNTVSGQSGTVGGGYQNTAGGSNATVGGGFGNTASGTDATVAGGAFNVAAGGGSFVAGSRAKNSNPDHSGVFLFADTSTSGLSNLNLCIKPLGESILPRRCSDEQALYRSVERRRAGKAAKDCLYG